MVQVILFGLGAAKAGTTWLYRYLANHPDCAMPAVKELHWFDTAEMNHWDRQIARARHECARRQKRLPTGDDTVDRRLRAKIDGYSTWAEVLETRGDDAAYRSFLAAQGGQVTGDVTPAYGTLSEDSLRRMQSLSPMARFVFLLRDPLDRFWSNIRMNAARRGGALDAAAHRLVNRALAGKDRAMAARCDYGRTLRRIGLAVPAAHVFTAFYETLFSDATIERLCRFLGITPYPAPTDTRVHASEVLTMSEMQRKRALIWLAPQYRAVARRFDTLPRRWTDNMEALA